MVAVFTEAQGRVGPMVPCSTSPAAPQNHNYMFFILHPCYSTWFFGIIFPWVFGSVWSLFWFFSPR